MQGGFSVKEAHAEVLIPVLQDVPFANGLNVTLADRYSKYGDFGSTSNWKIGVEYRPISDLLIRGTVSRVFRAPSVDDLFSPPSSGQQTLGNDPCNHITVANPACVGVPLNGSFQNNSEGITQTTTISSGSSAAGIALGPETGKSFDFGVMYSPRAMPGLSVLLDFWRIYLKNTITSLGPQAIVNACFSGQEAFCPLIDRFAAGTPAAGQIIAIHAPVANLGRTDVKGVDASVSYRLPATRFGLFDVSASAQYLQQYKIQTSPGLAGNETFDAAGIMSPTVAPLTASCPFSGGEVCFFPRITANGALNWQRGGWSASWRLRFIGKFTMGSLNPSQDASAIPGFAPGNPQVLRYGATVYNDFSLSYLLRPINTTFSVGIDNVFDKQPPELYTTNAPQSNTDVLDFDLLDRYYWARATVTF